MSDLYWLSVLANLAAVFRIGAILCIIVNIAVGIYILIADDMLDELYLNKLINFFKSLSILCIICIFGIVFIPCKHQLYMIYGIGGTIDYIKENTTAKQIPDKVIKACDIYLNNLIEEENEKHN